MTLKTKHVLDDALSLSVLDRASLVDNLIASLDQPDPHIDELWKIEVKSRMKAYTSGKMKSVSLEQALAKYKK